jgi:hypothetical protein
MFGHLSLVICHLVFSVSFTLCLAPYALSRFSIIPSVATPSGVMEQWSIGVMV